MRYEPLLQHYDYYMEISSLRFHTIRHVLLVVYCMHVQTAFG